MSPETLIRMANQIAAFFKAQGTATAPAAIAEHLQSFWDPRMRKAIIALEANGTATGLDPLAAQGGHVHVPGAILGLDPPGVEALREREGGASRRLGDRDFGFHRILIRIGK